MQEQTSQVCSSSRVQYAASRKREGRNDGMGTKQTEPASWRNRFGLFMDSSQDPPHQVRLCSRNNILTSICALQTPTPHEHGPQHPTASNLQLHRQLLYCPAAVAPTQVRRPQKEPYRSAHHTCPAAHKPRRPDSGPATKAHPHELTDGLH